MTILLSAPYATYGAGTTVDLDNATETALVAQGRATFTSNPGSAYYPLTPKEQQDLRDQFPALVSGAGTDGGQASAPLVADLLNARRVPGAVAVTLPTPYSAVGAAMVHPSVVYVDSSWNGYPFWMAVTPYPNNDSTYENPCILASTDGLTWIVPPGVTNPVIPWGGVVNAYYRDNHLIQDPTDATRQIMIYLLRDKAVTDKNYLYVTTSTDGWKTKTTPVQIWFGGASLTGLGANRGDLAAPSIWYDSGLSKWVIQGHNADYGTAPFPVQRITSSSLFSGWDQTAVTVSFPVPYSTPAPGRGWWHSHFAYDPATGVVYGLAQDNPTNNGAPGNIYIAWSTDGGLNYLSKPIDMKGFWYRPTFCVRKNRDGSKYLDCYFDTLLNTVNYRVSLRFDAYLYPALLPLRDLQLASSGLAPASIIFADDMNRVDGALGTPTIGSAYAAPSQGTWGITSKTIKAATVPAKQLIPTALNCRVSVRFKTVWQASGDNGWFWFRCKDTNNGYRIGFNTQANYRLQKIVAGSIDTTFRLAAANEPIGGLPTAGDVIEVRQNGARCEIYINDVFCEEFDDTSWYADGSGTNAQLQVSGSITAATFDALVVKRL